jgi:hypothetical protein
MAATIPTEPHLTDLIYPLWKVIGGSLKAVSVFIAAILSILIFTVKTILVLLQIVSQPVLWIFYPIFLVLSLLLNAVIMQPYRAIAYVAADTQDIWTLVGAALLVGALFGVCAGKLSNIAISSVIGIGPSKDPDGPPPDAVQVDTGKAREIGSNSNLGARVGPSARPAGRRRVEWSVQ